MSKLSKKEIDRRIKFFTDAVYRYQRLLGFMEVNISVLSQIKSSARASWYSEPTGALISICYSGSFIHDLKTTDDDIDITAFHEVYESQFYELDALLSTKYDSDYVAGMMHRIVRKAENTIYPLMRNQK